jgi:hypothetical protein
MALAIASSQPSQASGSILAVIVNKSNPDHRKLVLAQREPDSEVYQRLVQLVLRMTPSEYKRNLLRIEFQGAEPLMVKTLNSDDTAAKFVFNVPGAIAVIDAVPAGGAASRVKIVRIEGKLPGEPGYGL